MDRGDILLGVVIVIIIISIIELGAPLCSWLSCVSQNGQRYDVTVTVQAVERSTRFGDHTNLWVRVYGQQDITYKLIGFHNFEIGKTYHIIFVDEAYCYFFLVFQFEIRGRVVTIQEVK